MIRVTKCTQIGLCGGIGLLIACLLPGWTVPQSGHDTAKKKQYIKVEILGTLRHGIVAVGGETTGTEITAKNITWELDIGREAELRQLAEKLDGKEVIVKGELEVRKGIEISRRWIVKVRKMNLPEPDKKKE